MLRDTLLARLAEMGDAPDYTRLATEVLGVRGARADLARRLVAQALVIEDRRESWRRVGARVRREAPETPGVYVMRDAEGRVLYVGKAMNLHRRLASQFADRRWFALHPAVARVAAVEWQEVGSEIEALMREAMLIHTLHPEANVQTGRPSLTARTIPRRLLRDVVIIAPSIEGGSVELIAARADGGTRLQRTARNGSALELDAVSLWNWFHTARAASGTVEGALAPLVFSWLAGRGANTTRVDPHDSSSAVDLRSQLADLLSDEQLFTERLILGATK